MKEVLKKLRNLEAEMEEAEKQSEYWMQEEHLDTEKSDSYEAEADRLYEEVYKLSNQVADFIVSLTSGQIDKVMAMTMMRQRRCRKNLGSSIGGERMYDYDGDMGYFQRQLEKAGISQEEVDMNNYAGLTARELQSIVDGAIKTKQIRESKKEA